MLNKFLNVVIFLFLIPLFGQNYYQDSIPLPNNLPVVKNFLWGEKGMVRRLGFAPNSRISELKTRRKMLQLHQKLGLLTTSLLWGQSYIGYMIKDNPSKYGKNQDYDLTPYHRSLGYSGFSIYMTSASISLLAPPAYKYSNEFSSMKVHKYLAWCHFTGMILTPFLGYASTINPKYLEFHYLAGTFTTLTLTLAMTATFFP